MTLVSSDVFLEELKALKCHIDAEPAQARKHKGKFLLRFHPSSVTYARASEAERHVMTAYTKAVDMYLSGEVTLEQIATSLPPPLLRRQPMARKVRDAPVPVHPDLYFSGHLDQVQQTLRELSHFREICLKRGNDAAADIIAEAVKQGHDVLNDPMRTMKQFYDMRDQLCNAWYVCCTHISPP